MKKLTLMLLTISVIFVACKREPAKLWDSPDAYLGQSPPNDTPKVFAPGTLAEKGAWAGDRVAFSDDGKEFYYSHNNSWFSSERLKVKYLKYSGGKWNGPYVLNEKYYAPAFSPDGKTLYFIGGPDKKPNKAVVWQAHRAGTGWSAPVEYLSRTYALYDFMPTTSGNIYVGSNGYWGDKKNWQTYNFARINLSKQDTAIRSLGVPLNAPGFNGDFFVAKDESYMIISTKEHPDFECELYISFHKPDDSWTNPKSLGPLINNGLAHRWGEYVSPDNKYLFYTHGHSATDCFIFWVRFDSLLKRLKHTNFEPYVKDSLKTQTANVNQVFIFSIPANTFADDDGNNTLTYSISGTLPAGLIFDTVSKTISGKPLKTGNYNIDIVATDTARAKASSTLKINVGT